MISLIDADLTVDPDAGYGDLAFAQIRTADIVVINKTDLVTLRQLAQLRARVETIAPRARIRETTYGIVPLGLIFDDHLMPAMDDLRHRESHSQVPRHHEHGPERPFEAWP